MSSMGFGTECMPVGQHHAAQHLSHSNLQWLALCSFPERSGVQQGSPLSPLLYVIAAQPLASHLRRQSQLGIIRPITMPDGQPAPVSHQHADDTSLHVLQPRDAQVAIDTSIDLFCAASCSQPECQKVSSLLGSATATSLSLSQRLALASASSQASKQSSTWVFALDMTCQQLVITLSQASIRPSRR